MVALRLLHCFSDQDLTLIFLPLNITGLFWCEHNWADDFMTLKMKNSRFYFHVFTYLQGTPDRGVSCKSQAIAVENHCSKENDKGRENRWKNNIINPSTIKSLACNFHLIKHSKLDILLEAKIVWKHTKVKHYCFYKMDYMYIYIYKKTPEDIWGSPKK